MFNREIISKITVKLLLILASILILSVFGINESFSTPGTPPPGSTELKINHLPTLNEEFELTLSLVTRNYNSQWENASNEKTWPITFSITLPKSFEIMDDDFSEGGNYGFKRNQGYQTVSVTRDVGFPPETTVKIKPTESGLWQIIAEGDRFTSGKIFVVLTENYSYVSDKPNSILKKETCGDDFTFRSPGITVIDLNSQSIEKIIQDDKIKEKSYRNWELLGNSQSGLIYLYEYYETTIPILDMTSGKIVEHLDMYKQENIDKMVRVADLQQNTETGLIYMSNHGSPVDSIITIDDKTNSVVSNFRYEETYEDFQINEIAINSDNNTLYGVTHDGKIAVMDLNTEEIVIVLDNIIESDYVTDIKVNSNTNKIFVSINKDRQGEMHVIDGDTNKIVKTLSFDKQTYEITINEQTNEIYLHIIQDNTLRIIDGTDYSQTKIQFYDPSFEIEFDFTERIAYISNDDGSISVIDFDDFKVDLIYNCSIPSGMFLDSVNQKLYLVGDINRSAGNVLDSKEIPSSAKLKIVDPNYPRNEYLVNENIELIVKTNNEFPILLDSVFIKNLDNDKITFTFSEFKSISLEEPYFTINWNQLNNDGKKVPNGNYALIVNGHDNNNTIYEAQQLLSIINQTQLENLQSLHNDMFSYLKTNNDSKNTTLSSDLDNSISEKTQSDIPSDIITCKNNPVLVTWNNEKFACVTHTTSEKLVLRGWDIISKKSKVVIPDDNSENIMELKRNIMLDFPLSSEFVGNGIARFNVEFSHVPTLNEEFDITVRFELLDDEIFKKKTNKTIPFTLTLGDGIEYIRGDMKEIERKYSLATEKYNTMYKAENPKTSTGIYESTSTLKFSQSGEQNIGFYVSGQFDAFWFFVDDDGTVYMKEDVIYDYRKLSTLMQILTANNPESIDSELKDIFDKDSKRVLEEYYEYFEYYRPIAPVDISTTKVQLRDIICPDDIFYRFTQSEGHNNKGMRCGSESTLEYYSEISLDVFNRDEAMKLLTVNTDSVTTSEENIFVDTRDIQPSYNEWGFIGSGNKDEAILPPPYYYLGQHCANNALYATFKVPEQVKIGDAFDVILTYNWKLPNSNWDMMSEKDKKTMQKLRDEYIPLAEVEEMVNNNQTTWTEKELDDLDDQMDAISDQMEDILEKYELDDNSDFNRYGYQITEYYPECDEPVLKMVFPEEIEILSDGFETTTTQDKQKLVTYLGKKMLSFNNNEPQTSSITLIVNEPTFNLINSLNIDVAGNSQNFIFSTDNDVVTFASNYSENIERMSSMSFSTIDKYGNKLSLQEQGRGNSYSWDGVLGEYARLNNMNTEEKQMLQLKFIKHQILSPDDDFITFYKNFSGKDVSNEIDFVKLGPPIDSIAEFIREHISKDEDNIEEWLISQDQHPDWIEEFLKQYPEFKH